MLPNHEAILTELLETPRVWAGNGGAEDSTRGLIDLCRAWVKPDMTVVEVGSFAGVSTACFACFAHRVIAVDPFEAAKEQEIPPERILWAHEEFLKRMRIFKNISLIRATSADAARLFCDSELDFVYLDGHHKEKWFLEDVRAWKPKLGPKGILAGHDFRLVKPLFSVLGLPRPNVRYADDSWVLVE